MQHVKKPKDNKRRKRKEIWVTSQRPGPKGPRWRELQGKEGPSTTQCRGRRNSWPTSCCRWAAKDRVIQRWHTCKPARPRAGHLKKTCEIKMARFLSSVFLYYKNILVLSPTWYGQTGTTDVKKSQNVHTLVDHNLPKTHY